MRSEFNSHASSQTRMRADESLPLKQSCNFFTVKINTIITFGYRTLQHLKDYWVMIYLVEKHPCWLWHMQVCNQTPFISFHTRKKNSLQKWHQKLVFFILIVRLFFCHRHSTCRTYRQSTKTKRIINTKWSLAARYRVSFD